MPQVTYVFHYVRLGALSRHITQATGEDNIYVLCETDVFSRQSYISYSKYLYKAICNCQSVLCNVLYTIHV